MDYGELSLEFHKKNHGKLAVTSKVTISNKDDLALAYTPGVGRVSQEIAEHPDTAREYTLKRNTVAIVSDGSAVLGLGNLGPLAAIPVMEGKAVLFKQFANVDAFPICLDTHDTEAIITAVKQIAPVFGGINLEDIAAPQCFEIERRLKEELNIPVMHDDQHGTAVVVLAGLINSIKLMSADKSAVRIVVNGVGAAGIAITKLALLYGFKNIILCDSKGIISKDRTDLNSEKQELLELVPKANPGSLVDAMTKADIFIGVSKGGIVSAEMLKVMNAQPAIFALANPIPEIMPDIAKANGAFIVATGRSDFPNQINNVLAFPGIFRGALDNNVVQITDHMLIQAAEALAGLVANPTPEKILPGVFEEGIAEAVANAIR